MKKVIVFLLLLSVLLSFSACRQSYRKINVPKELSLDVSALTEDTDKMMSIDDTTPLIAALPDEGLYIYATDPTITSGILVKYDGLIQFFSWNITSYTAEPDVFLADYNGDGQKDIAFTYCDTASEIVHNENLHILLRTEDGFTDHVYKWKSAAVDMSMGIVVNDNGDGTLTASLDGTTATAALDTTGFGAYRGIYADNVQDFTLGDTITLTVKPGLVFNDRQLPVYDVFVCTAKIHFIENDVLRATDLQIDAAES